MLHNWPEMVLYLLVFVKQIRLFCHFVHKYILVIDIYAQKVKGTVFVDINIQVVKLDQFNPQVVRWDSTGLSENMLALQLKSLRNH